MPNSDIINGSLVNGLGYSIFDNGIIASVLQDVQYQTEDSINIAIINQSVGIARAENIFIIFDQVVLLRSITPSGEFVCFYQDIQKTTDEQNFITLNQKVIT